MTDPIMTLVKILRSELDEATYDRIMAALARHITEDTPVATKAPYEPVDIGRGPGTDTGHGHVWRRPDGLRARGCGYGEGRCQQCADDNRKFGVSWPDRLL